MKKAIFLYDYTGLMAQPWMDAGYQCWCFDGQHEQGVKIEGDHVKVGFWFTPFMNDEDAEAIFQIVGEGVDFVFGFPECTDMAVSGAVHFEKKMDDNPTFQHEAVSLAVLVEVLGRKYGCKWGLENPVSVLSSIWRKADYKFHPYEYGGYLPENDVHPQFPEYIAPRDAYPKKTCVWAGNGFMMPPKKSVYCPPGYSQQHLRLGGKSLKTKNIRSATPRGFSKAVFEYNKK